MLRFRRYRVFLVVAIFAVFILYHFTTVRDWEDARDASLERLKYLGLKHTVGMPTPTPVAGSTAEAVTGKDDSKKVDAAEAVAVKTATQSKSPTSSTAVHAKPTIAIPHEESGDYGTFGLSGQGRHEVPPNLEDKPVIHWERLPEHFPLPADSLIPIPTQKPLSIPKIQYAFTKESSTAKADREAKLAEIKQAMKHSWTGYREYAWMHDELSPVSGGFRDPFCSWSATLVDALDTLWIMGMESEFLEAVRAVGEIDFTTSPRKDIPVFETTIRYLGGLLAAYDISGGKHKILLDKAEQLGDVLMGAFDTPNRMPIGYYYWRPTFAKNPHRAGTRSVMAELGSLSVEFTRLAQLTKNNRYYDAIARITDEFEQLQNHTQIPGLWPTLVDASGCRKPERPKYDSVQESAIQNVLQDDLSHPYGPQAPVVGPAADAKAVAAAIEKVEGKGVAKAVAEVMEEAEEPVGFDTRPASEIAKDSSLKPSAKRKRQLEDAELNVNQPVDTDNLIEPNLAPEKVDCEPQGLDSPPYSELETFSMGGQADSTFEYLPKMYMLLGGVIPKYQTMYENVIAAVNKHMLFRPMVPDSRDLRAVGVVQARRDGDGKSTFTLRPELTHLTCFVGGMYGIGGKIFERAEDVEIAQKLADTCVWAYGQTATGIMPEAAQLLPCDDMTDCKWEKAKWYEALDPYREYREAGEKIHRETQKFLATQKQKEADAAKEKESAEPMSQSTPNPSSDFTSDTKSDSQADSNSGPPPDSKSEVHDTASSGNSRIAGSSEEASPDSSLGKRQVLREDSSVEPIPDDLSTNASTSLGDNHPFLTHEEYVEGRLARENIPEGIPLVQSRHYILRPEAIESVFIMYRITGNESWREKGWRMFQGIQKHCRAEYGYSAIGDVTDPQSYQLDEMESFWLAETLKYFYLLFSTPNVVSLDEYVFNTEAHPFKRPK